MNQLNMKLEDQFHKIITVVNFETQLLIGVYLIVLLSVSLCVCMHDNSKIIDPGAYCSNIY